MTDQRTSEVTQRLADSRARFRATVELALESDFRCVELDDSEPERRRQTAIASRRSQRSSQELAIQGLARKFADPREDPEFLQDRIDDLRRQSELLGAEIDDLVASASMKFPSATEVANVSGAVGVLEARVGAAAAASAIVRAASGVLQAWPI
jgi:hypothetical protein